MTGVLASLLSDEGGGRFGSSIFPWKKARLDSIFVEASDDGAHCPFRKRKTHTPHCICSTQQHRAVFSSNSLWLPRPIPKTLSCSGNLYCIVAVGDNAWNCCYPLLNDSAGLFPPRIVWCIIYRFWQRASSLCAW